MSIELHPWFQFRGLFLRCRLRGRCPPLTGLCMGLVGTRVSVTRTTLGGNGGCGCCFFRLPGGGDLCIFFILIENMRLYSYRLVGYLQGSAKRWSPSCVNAAGKARPK